MEGAGIAVRHAAARAAFWLPAVGVIALAVGLYWGISSRAPGSIPVKPATPPSLNVAFTGNRLRLSWDPQISTRADRAALWITDGPETVRLELDSKQLSDGSLVYWPNHSDVEFRLETLSPGVHSTESVRAIGRPPQAVGVPQAPPTVAMESPTPVLAAPATPRRNRTRHPVSSPDRPRPKPTGTASRQMPVAFEKSRADRAPATAATIALPEAPTIQPAAAPPPASGKELLKLVDSPRKPEVADLPFRVSLEPVPASRRSFPTLKRSVRADYVPPAVLRNPGLVNPPHRSIAREVNIDVKVYVNPSGKVDYSEVLSSVEESNRDLAALAVFSARRWEFVPARTRDGAVAGEMIIHYRFGPSAREGGSGSLAGR